MVETVPDIDDSNIRAAFDREKLGACHIGDATSHVSASLFNPFFYFFLFSSWFSEFFVRDKYPAKRAFA